MSGFFDNCTIKFNLQYLCKKAVVTPSKPH
jgi:hypothetical protein